MTLTLLEFCKARGIGTDKQLQYLKAYLEEGTLRKAAAKFKVHHSAIRAAVKALEKKAALVGYAPGQSLDHPTAEGFEVERASTLYGEDGSLKLQWVKIKQQRENLLQQLEEATEQLCGRVKGKAARVKTPKSGKKDLLTAIPMGDAHIGMYAWSEECGEDFDCDIAIRDLTSATYQLVEGAPATEKCLIVNLGDFFHGDNNQNVTPRSKHALDTDTRWPRVLRVGVEAMCNCISFALEKFKQVHVYNIIGNHDEHSAVALSMILKAYYDKEPRVVIDSSLQQFKRFRFGKTLLGMAHGHTLKPEKLSGIMLREWPDDCSGTRYRYWLTGHVHHKQCVELSDCVVESFRTLAARDAWHANQGYGAGRDLVRITYHREYGEWGRQIAPIEMVRKLQEK